MKRFEKFYRVYLERRAKPDKTIKEHTQELFDCFDQLCCLGYIKDESVKSLTALAIYFHDHGKANIEFEKRLESKKRFNPQEEVGHNLLSAFMIDPKEDYFEEGDRENKRQALAILQYVVLNHHHYVDNFEAIQSEKICSLAVKNLAGLPYFPFKNRTIQAMAKVQQLPLAIKVLGLLNKCDYAASGGVTIEYKNDFLEGKMENLLKSWQQQNQKASWNELQYYCKAHCNENLIITAPTGMGKTEAALHWIGNHKGFFVLPLRTAINAMFVRIRDQVIFKAEQIDERLALLHSDTLSIYNQMSNESKREEDQDWNILDYHKKSRQMALPLNIATPDQLFDFVFKQGAYELKLATLAYSKVVIDEIQAYNAELLAYLIYGIHKLSSLGGAFCILTATLPPFIKDLLVNVPNGETISVGIRDFSSSDSQVRHFLEARDRELTGEDIIAAYQKQCKQGKLKKILVVCNTIKKAQEIYQSLKDAQISNIKMLHSKFIKTDRSCKEAEILKDGLTYKGKTEELQEKSVIWVATTLVEASLDIDFDELYTELSDLSGLFQRLGRCNRKGVKPVTEANCFVYLQINKNLLNDGSDRGFIDKKIHTLSKEAIQDWNGVIRENDKQNLIQTYLTTEKLETDKVSAYLKKYREHYFFVNELNPAEFNFNLSYKFRNIISYTVIPQEVYEKNKVAIQSIQEKLDFIDQEFQNDYLKSRGDSSKMKKAEKEEKILKRVQWRQELLNYTVSVGHYDVYYSNSKKKESSLISSKIQIGKQEEILVIEGHYDAEIGFRRLSKDEIAVCKQESVEQIEDFSDSFM